MSAEWRKRAACLGLDTAIFFPVKGHASDQAAAAKAICSACPVRRDCLEDIMAYEAGGFEGEGRHGIFGGLSPKERRWEAARRRLEAREAAHDAAQPASVQGERAALLRGRAVMNSA